MWVQLTRRGYKRVLDLTANDEAMYAELHQSLLWRSGTGPQSGVDVEAPYVVWKHVHGLLYKEAFKPRGTYRYGGSSTLTSLKRVTKEMNYIETHPALSRYAMIEWQPDVLPVWKVTPDNFGREYSPMPHPGHEFVVLTPMWERTAGQRVTRWVERESGPGRLGTEELHLRLQRNPVL
jgi:hypothetical protein